MVLILPVFFYSEPAAARNRGTQCYLDISAVFKILCPVLIGGLPAAAAEIPSSKTHFVVTPLTPGRTDSAAASLRNAGPITGSGHPGDAQEGIKVGGTFEHIRNNGSSRPTGS